MAAGRPMTRWQALDAWRGTHGPIHERVDRPDGKIVRWRALDGGFGLGEHRMADLIYADRLPMPGRVVITEGEKAADAIRAAGIEAVGTVCGAGAIPGVHVLELFTGCHVTLWPDADAAGRDHMSRLSRGLEPIVGSLRLVDLPPDVPTGWDAADATEAQIRRLVALAHDVWLFRPDCAWYGPLSLVHGSHR